MIERCLYNCYVYSMHLINLTYSFVYNKINLFFSSNFNLLEIMTSLNSCISSFAQMDPFRGKIYEQKYQSLFYLLFQYLYKLNKFKFVADPVKHKSKEKEPNHPDSGMITNQIISKTIVSIKA